MIEASFVDEIRAFVDKSIFHDHPFKHALVGS